jgi:hypothetical protein
MFYCLSLFSTLSYAVVTTATVAVDLGVAAVATASLSKAPLSLPCCSDLLSRLLFSPYCVATPPPPLSHCYRRYCFRAAIASLLQLLPCTAVV